VKDGGVDTVITQGPNGSGPNGSTPSMPGSSTPVAAE
jgi:hypothetical protein